MQVFDNSINVDIEIDSDEFSKVRSEIDATELKGKNFADSFDYIDRKAIALKESISSMLDSLRARAFLSM